MKKILLFVSACLFAFWANAQKTIVLNANSWGDEVKNYNYQGSTAVSAGEWKEGDVITVEFKGSVENAVKGLQFVIIDQSEAAGWWKELSGYESIGDFEENGEINFSKEITLVADVADPAGVNAVFSTEGSTEEVTGSVTIALSTFTIEKPGEEPSPDAPYVDAALGTLAPIWGDDNKVIGKTMTFGTSDSGIGFSNYDGGFNFSAYKSLIFELEAFPTWAEYGQVIVVDSEDNSIKASFEGATAVVDLSEVAGTVKQIYLQCGGTGDVTLKSVTLSEEAPVVPEPAYVDPVLGTLSVMWGTNSISGKTMKFVDSDTGIGFANYDGGFDLSAYKSLIFELEEFPTWAEYGQIVVVYGADGKESAKISFVENTAVVDLSEIEGGIMQIYLQCGWKEGNGGEVTLKSISLSTNGSAVEDVAKLAVEGGFVYSAGEIVVYNIAGKIVATASQVFNVNSLDKGVYFISAPEGVIKYMK